MSNMPFSVRARHSSPTLPPVRELTTSSAHQIAPSQVFVSPMAQSTPPIGDLTTVREHQIAPIVEVLPVRWEPAEEIHQECNPIKQQLLSSSPLYSTII